MWPQALQMTRDECRGILRRLELESYSQVISVFRAQGGLSDAKAKLLEELRGIFHISNERHRAEARRVANDEQLATIAEAISGPNTWQEWSREGRRPYPMLPRVAPQTALALLANNVAEETTQENSKLPYPAATADAIKEEQLQIENQKSLEAAVERSNYVVTSDPFKVPDIPQNHKKNLKRNSDHQNIGMGKKRSLGDSPAQQGYTQTVRKNYPHITASSPQTNSAITSVNAGNERKQKLIALSDPHLEKQRFFHRQHQITKQKAAKKAAAAAAAAANNATMGGGPPLKRQATPAKSGRRANQKLQKEQQKQLSMKQRHVDIQHQKQIPMQIDFTGTGNVGTTATTGGAAAAQAILTQQQIDMQFVTYATQHQPPQQIFMDKDIEMTHSQLSAMPAGAASSTALAIPLSSSNQHLPSLINPLSSPQIAASKRDISKNLNKLQMQQNQQLSSNVLNVSSVLTTPAPMPSHDLQTSLGNILSTVTSPSDKIKSSDKTLISTTPVQKYIVEERQPGVAINLPTGGNTNTLVNIQNPHGSTSSSTHIIQVSNAGHQPQIMSFPQISAAATKLRAVNTTLIAPGSKITSTSTKKVTPATISTLSTGTIGSSGGSSINAGALHELANVASTQSQVLHIVEAVGNNTPINVAHGTPLHTPSAVIQIQNTAVSTAATSPDISATSSQSKVLTTKILPLMLTGSGNQNSGNSNLLNSSTLSMASSSTSSVSVTSSTPTTGATTIKKSLASNMVLNTSTANLTPVTVTSTNNAIISTMGTGASMFRKPPNVIKTSVAATTPTKSPASSAPHIISNVKLTPVSVGPSSAGTHLTTASTFKNVLPSTSGMVRTSVKICQSPNGKVFIQPTSLMDGSKMKLNTSTMSHKIISSTPTANSSATTSSGQRVAIQKVQIIPASLCSPAGGNALQSAGNHINTKTGKNNMIFMPTTATNVRPVTLSKMGNNILLKSSANKTMTPTSPTTTLASAAGDNSLAKSNIVVLGPSPTTPVKEQLSQNIKLDNSQLINEDTPLDILNMPIVMEPGVGVTSSSSTAETVTVLQSNIIDASNVSSPSALASPIILDQTQLNQTSKTVVLNVDWEMKLDIEQQNQYNHKNLKQNKRTLSSSSSATQSISGNQQQSSHSTSSHGIKQKQRINNDYISLSKESANSATTTTSMTLSNPANNMIVLDDSFDDVIVEEHEDDASSITLLDKNSQQQQQNDNDIPKILDMQIYQQHDGHDNRVAEFTTTNNNDDDDEINVNDDDDDIVKRQPRQFLHTQESSLSDIEQAHQQLHHEESQLHQQLQHAESEADAAFDETIVTEIDENTAIEFIEEDGVSSNVLTTRANKAILSKKNIMQPKAPTSNLATTATACTISKQEGGKSGNTISNSHLVSSISSEKNSTATTSSSESFPIEPTTTNDTQETTANNSATQQVEP